VAGTTGETMQKIKINFIKIRLRLLLPILLTVLLAGSGSLFARSHGQQWSTTSPEINLGHIFEGAINRRGKATGFHSRPQGKDPKHARLVKILSPANQSGVYTARVEIYDPAARQWKEKFSTLFPDNLSREQVVQLILKAWKNRRPGKGSKWEGSSGKGFIIQGYLNKRGNINTAYPVYQKP
jgi:hypothetical protein